MLEFLFKLLKVSFGLFKRLICRLIYINHNYIIVKTEKPFYTHEITGSGQGEYVTEGIVVYATIQCKFCGKTKRINLFGDAIPIRYIPKINLETSYPNDVRTRLVVTFEKYRKGLFRLNISEKEFSFLEDFTKKYNSVKCVKINGEYILLLSKWGDKPNEYKSI